MHNLAFVFSGQGAQYSGMGRELYEVSPAAKSVFDLADTIRKETSQQCFYGTKEKLTQTINTQPCLYCVDLAAAKALREAGIIPNAVAGFSLGELAALTFSGAVEEQDGFKLVCKRGELMDRAAQQFDSSMLAVLKLDNNTVEKICQKYINIFPVNYNCPNQLVVAGLKDEIEEFKMDIKQAGGRIVPLSVSGGFHSPFMQQASEEFAEELNNYLFSKATIPVYSNYTAQLYGEDTKELLVNQMKNPVRWQQLIENMISAGIEIFIEVGAGKTLSGLISKISQNVKVYNVEDKASLEATLVALKSSGVNE